MCCEVRDVSMVWSYIHQPPGQDSTAEGDHSWAVSRPLSPSVGGSPIFAAVLQHRGTWFAAHAACP